MVSVYPFVAHDEAVLPRVLGGPLPLRRRAELVHRAAPWAARHHVDGVPRLVFAVPGVRGRRLGRLQPGAVHVAVEEVLLQPVRAVPAGHGDVADALGRGVGDQPVHRVGHLGAQHARRRDAPIGRGEVLRHVVDRVERDVLVHDQPRPAPVVEHDAGCGTGRHVPAEGLRSPERLDHGIRITRVESLGDLRVLARRRGRDRVDVGRGQRRGGRRAGGFLGRLRGRCLRRRGGHVPDRSAGRASHNDEEHHQHPERTPMARRGAMLRQRRARGHHREPHRFHCVAPDVSSQGTRPVYDDGPAR